MDFEKSEDRKQEWGKRVPHAAGLIKLGKDSNPITASGNLIVGTWQPRVDRGWNLMAWLGINEGKASRTSVRVSGELTKGPYPEDKGPGGIQKNSGEKPGRRAINEEDKRTRRIHSLPLNHLSHKN
ncbi:hypothetical protein E3N88_32166 [Mikania micrantha]|uniref:Uncharacterized protein n=1 Tax=Mikania micrantha TaxID=192012 RepID=A0A5N6M873_9ASTR|nr:hypothetical protein E3N88_32166 [Mikania micrantha]